MTRSEMLAVYDLLSVTELANLLDLGGTLPSAAHNRFRRLAAAEMWRLGVAAEQREATPKRPTRAAVARVA